MFDIFLDIASMTVKFSGNVHFINSKSHAKYYGRVSTGRDATPRVQIHACSKNTHKMLEAGAKAGQWWIY
jgi:hypothetical protein